MESYPLTPVTQIAEAYPLTPETQVIDAYPLTPVDAPAIPLWTFFRAISFSANEMLDSAAGFTWSNTPGDYKNSMGSITLPESAVAVRIVPKNGAQCFHAYTTWAAVCKFKTQKGIRDFDTNARYGSKPTKGEAETDFLKLPPRDLQLGADKQLHWGAIDTPIADNTDDEAWFNIYYRETA
jgi:hypothetical protein